jgi:hypothetical protein
VKLRSKGTEEQRKAQRHRGAKAQRSRVAKELSSKGVSPPFLFSPQIKPNKNYQLKN